MSRWNPKVLIGAVLASVLIFSVGCNGSDNGHFDSDRPFYAALFSKVMDGLLGGATGEVGGDVMGLVLSLLGWGSSGDDQEAKTLSDMDKKLGEIVDELENIENELQALMTQMAITEEEILANANDPSGAITQIGTFHDELQQISGGKKPGEGDQTKINAFADQIQNNFQIENDVNLIFHAISPQTVAKSPVLNNFTDLLNNRYHAGNGGLDDAYGSLELYTSQLVYNQLKGVNLVTEAKQVKDDKATALAYLKSYDTNVLTKEMDSPDEGVSFRYNVWRLALLNLDTLPYRDGQSYLSQDIVDFLARATFFRLKTLSAQHFGMRVLLFATQDVAGPTAVYAVKPGAEYTLSCAKVGSDVPGKAYAHWSSNRIKPASTYDVYECLPSGNPDDVETGTYDLYFDPINDTAPITTLTVQYYDADYTVDAGGKIKYGHAASLVRSAWNHFPESSPHWSFSTTDMYLSHHSGGANDWPIHLYGAADGEYEYTGAARLHAHFRYDGTSETTVYMDYSVHFHGYVEAWFSNATGGSHAHSQFVVGVYDDTAGGNASSDCTNDYDKKHSASDSKNSFTNHATGVCHFTAKPGHDYHVYINMKINGISGTADNAKSSVYMDGVDYIYLHL